MTAPSKSSRHTALCAIADFERRVVAGVANNPDWQPHDIAVLTPNIEPYSLFIEAVFGQDQAGSQALPYSISDVKLSRRQPLLYALAQTLDLLESRFEVDKVLPLLESRLVLQRFGLSEEDVPLLHETVAGLNVHWGLDQPCARAKTTSLLGSRRRAFGLGLDAARRRQRYVAGRECVA